MSRRIKCSLTFLAILALGGAVASAHVSHVGLGSITEDWVVRWDGPWSLEDGLYDLAVDSYGNVYAAGRVRADDSTGAARYVGLIKIGPDGGELWSLVSDIQATNHQAVDSGVSLALDLEGNVIVATESTTAHESGDYVVVKLAPDGTERWRRVFDGPTQGSDTPADVAADGFGNVYVLGTSSGPSCSVSCYLSASQYHDFVLLKYDPDGNLLWLARYNGGGEEEARALAIDGVGGVVVAGRTQHDPGTGLSRDLVVVRYDAVTGAEEWVRTYDGPGSRKTDTATALAVDPDGGLVFVTGWSDASPGITHIDYVTIAYDAFTGDEMWTARTDGFLWNDTAVDAVVDPIAGAVYVTGTSLDQDNLGRDYLTAAYEEFTGLELWTARLEEPFSSTTNGARALTLDGYGHVVATGQSQRYGSADFVTVAYEPDTGDIFWEVSYDGTGGNRDTAVAVAVGPDGGIHVAGPSRGQLTEEDFAVVKYVYASTDGDGDGVEDDIDNCPTESNPDQADFDGDGLGDACDPDDDGDGVADLIDRCPGENASGFDADSDGCIDTLSGLAEMLQTLVSEGVVDTELMNSLLAKLESAGRSADKENICAAVQKLEALQNEVQAQRGKKISEEAAERIVSYIDNVITGLVVPLLSTTDPEGDGATLCAGSG